MKIPFSQLHDQNNKRLNRATRKKAIMINYNGYSKSADICFLDNPQTIIKGVSLSYQVIGNIGITIPAGGTVNLRCIVDVFDESNSAQMVIAYTY